MTIDTQKRHKGKNHASPEELSIRKYMNKELEEDVWKTIRTESEDAVNNDNSN